MELKQSTSWGIVDDSGTFNRTILELKHFIKIDPAKSIFTFNRTILELKQIKKLETATKAALLIEPFWN